MQRCTGGQKLYVLKAEEQNQQAQNFIICDILFANAEVSSEATKILFS